MARTTLVGRIEQELRRRISVGIYPPDSYLPPERQLAAQFGTTRRTLRLALAALAQDELIERVPHRGTRILSPLGRLAEPLIGIVQARPLEGRSASVPWLQDSLATFNGVQDAVARLKLKHEFIFAHPDHGLSNQDISRFGAFLFIENGRDWGSMFNQLQERGVPFVVAKLEKDIDVPCT